MSILLVSCHLAVLLSMPFVLVGLINRTKALWAGRRGPPIMQAVYDTARLLRKESVYSQVTTSIFQSGSQVVLATSLAAGLFSPLLGAFAPFAFDYDFVAVAYTLGLGRVMLMLSAMDAGSSFEGMGASREAWFSMLAEPALFVLLGALAIATGKTSFAALLGGLHTTPHFGWTVVPAALALLILLQTETARVPVDDPLTHLELTMIHEVMILDHSGPDLAAMQVAAGLKLTLYAGMIAALLNPYDPTTQLLPSTAACLLLMGSVAVVVGTIESLVARLRMKWVPRYVLGAGVAAGLALAALSLAGGAP